MTNLLVCITDKTSLNKSRSKGKKFFFTGFGESGENCFREILGRRFGILKSVMFIVTGSSHKYRHTAVFGWLLKLIVGTRGDLIVKN